MCNGCESEMKPRHDADIYSEVEAYKTRLALLISQWGAWGHADDSPSVRAEKLANQAEFTISTEVGLTEPVFRDLAICAEMARILSTAGRVHPGYDSPNGVSIRAMSGGLPGLGKR